MQGSDGEKRCPNCDFSIVADQVDCPACGIVFARWRHNEPLSDEPTEGDDYTAPGVWIPGMLLDARGSGSPAEAAGLLQLPRPLRWFANLQIAGGVMGAIIAVVSFHFSHRMPEFRAPAISNAIMAVVSFALAYMVRRRMPVARVFVIIAAICGLLAIPVVTVLSILLLVYMFHDGMPILFSRKSPEELTREEIDLLREVHDASSGIWFVRITAVSLVLSMVVIGVLIGLGGVAAFRGSMKSVKAANDMAVIDYSVRDAIVSHTGAGYPPTQRIDDLMRTLRTEIPTIDPWGRPYRYQKSGSTFRVGSAGPDGRWTYHGLFSYEVGGSYGDDIIVERGSVFGSGGLARNPPRKRMLRH